MSKKQQGKYEGLIAAFAITIIVIMIAIGPEEFIKTITNTINITIEAFNRSKI